MIELLDWDTEFFGYKVGLVNLNNTDPLEVLSYLKGNHEFSLVYLISLQELKHLDSELQLVDIKIRLQKQLSFSIDLPLVDISEYNGLKDEVIINLALQSGVYSRFKIDANFRNLEYERLYKKWIEGSLNKTIADKILTENNELGTPIGFVTLKFYKDHAEIGLLAVDENYRGKGVGSLLLKQVELATSQMQLSFIEVVTQGTNEAALRLYKKDNYEIFSKKYIYHYWNLTSGK